MHKEESGGSRNPKEENSDPGVPDSSQRDGVVSAAPTRRRFAEWGSLAANWAQSELAAVCLWLVVFLSASSAVGYVFGWLIGAAESPVAGSALKAVFGLLAVAGLSAGSFATFKRRLLTKAALYRGICLGLAIVAFCSSTWLGIQRGIFVRTVRYDFPTQYLANYLDLLSPEILGVLHQSRQVMRREGITALEYRGTLDELVVPILVEEDQPAKRLARLEQVLAPWLNEGG